MSIYRRAGKRALDIALTLPALLLLSPLLALAALLVRITLGTPILFRQERGGLGGKIFTIYKFRTMTDARAPDGTLLPDVERLTWLGRILRSTSLDELPELLNVFKGDMSLVGPRPWLARYLDLYTPEQTHRHDVKPGVTGWAQVNGRNAISWEEKIALDLWYVDNVSFGLDVRIVAATVWKILKREGISEQGHATAQEFTGASQ